MESYTQAEKVQLVTLKKALRATIRKGDYWIEPKEVNTLIDLAGIFLISETLAEMGYRIADRANSGAIHIAKL